MSESYLIGTVTDSKGLKVQVYATSVDGGVKIDVKVASGKADLRGFFMDVGDSTSGVSVDGAKTSKVKDEGVTSVGNKDNNMNGTGEKFDIGVEFGSAGKGKGKGDANNDIDEASFIVKGITLDDLDGLTFGVRATSVGDCKDRGDSVKLVGVMDVPDQPPPIGNDHFPFMDFDITSLTFYYKTASGDVNSDGVYAIKVDTPYSFNDDLDVKLDIFRSYILDHDPFVTDASSLLGVAIAVDGGSESYYSIDGNHDIDTPPTLQLISAADVEVSYNYNDIFPMIPS